MNEKLNSIRPNRGSLIFLAIYILVVILLSLLALRGASAFGYRFLTFKEAINGGIEFKGGSAFYVRVSSNINSGDTTSEDITSEDTTLETTSVDETQSTTEAEKVPLTEFDFKKTIDIISNRLKRVDANINIMAIGENVIRIEAGKTVNIDTCRVLSTVGLVEIKGTPEAAEGEEVEAKVILNSDDIKSCIALYNQEARTYSMQLTFKDKAKLKEVTSEYLSKELTFYIDDTEISKFTIQDISDNGILTISEMNNIGQIELIALMINDGKLQVATEVGSVFPIDASFGTDVGTRIIIATACIFVILAIALFFLYKISGLMAFVSIASWGLIWAIVFINLGETLNIAVLIGLIASLFMVIITSVYILGNIRKICDDSKKFDHLIDQVYSTTSKQIVFANTGVIILGVILFLVGGASYEGLALSIMLGSACTLISIMVITRMLMKLSLSAGIIKGSNMFIGAKGGMRLE